MSIVNARLSGESGPVDIITYDARYGADFTRLNVEWLEKHFSVEPIDEEIFADIEGRILRPGGCILFARVGETIVGTCALINAGRGRFELAKMAVTERYQGKGIGRMLMAAVLEEFRRNGGTELFLETNSGLGAAMHLYETSGFVRTPHPDGRAHYSRADVYMVHK